MHSRHSYRLMRELLLAGVPVWRIRRTVRELHDHYHDIEAEALAAGCTVDEARREAAARLGDLDELVRSFAAMPGVCAAARPAWMAAGLTQALILVDDIEAEALPGVARWCSAGCVAAFGTALLLWAFHALCCV